MEGNSQRLEPWWRNPYLVLLAFVLGVLAFSECAPLFSSRYISFHRIFPRLAVESINIAVSCLGALVLYLLLMPRNNRERVFIFGTGAILEAWLIYLRSHFMGPWGQLLNLGVGFFPGIVLALLWRWFGHKRRHEALPAQRCAEVLGLSIAMPVLFTFGSTLIGQGYDVYDAMLLAADSMFGTQISFIVSKYMTDTLGMRLFGYIAYFYLALFMILAQLITYSRSRDNNTAEPQPYVIPAFLFIVSALLGSMCYFYLPAVGTAAYCGSAIYPQGPIPSVEGIPHTVSAPPSLARNCMPSLHLTWILCAFFAVRNLKKVYKYVGTAIVISVLLSAFSVGNHWISDFIGSLPFTAFCLGLTSTKAPRQWRLWATLYCGPCFSAFVYMIKNNIIWIMDHQALYLGLITLMDISAWIICLKLLPPEHEISTSADATHLEP